MFANSQLSDPRNSYDALAPHYDAFTNEHEYDCWTEELVRLVEGHGLQGRRVLDVGCGTGKSFLPLLRRGWTVTGCDLSAAMLDEARLVAGPRVELHVADARALPTFGVYDLVWALCDVVNYVLDADGLDDAFRGMRDNLAPGGRILIDCPTRRSFCDFFGCRLTIEHDGRFMVWGGRVDPATFEDGQVAEGVIEAFVEEDDGLWRRTTSEHRQRHHSAPAIHAALEAAGLTLLAGYGQTKDLRFESVLDEERHTRAIYIAAHESERR